MRRVADDIEIISAIDMYIEHYGAPPSCRNLVLMLGYASPSSIHSRLRHLAQKGYITRQPRIARSIVLLPKAFALLHNIEEVA